MFAVDRGNTRNVKVFLKVFVWMGLPFGAMMALFDLADGDVGLHTVLRPLIFGGFMAVIVGSSHARAVRGTDQTLPDRYERTIEVPLPTFEVERRAFGVAPSLAKRIQKVDHGHVRLFVPSSSETWGEVMDVRFVARAPDLTVVNLASRLRTSALVDYGKNRQNVERLVGVLAPSLVTDRVDAEGRPAPVAGLGPA